MKTSDPYEYLPPHGSAAPYSRAAFPETLWSVEIPWGSETISRKVMARDRNHALRKVGMEISRSVNLIPSKVFMQINREKKFKVTHITSSFEQRAVAVTKQPAKDAY